MSEFTWTANRPHRRRSGFQKNDHDYGHGKGVLFEQVNDGIYSRSVETGSSLLLKRSSTEPVTIQHKGYLLKRSNKPVSRTQSKVLGTLQPTYHSSESIPHQIKSETDVIPSTVVEIATNIEIQNNPIDIAVDLISDFFGFSETLLSSEEDQYEKVWNKVEPAYAKMEESIPRKFNDSAHTHANKVPDDTDGYDTKNVNLLYNIDGINAENDLNTTSKIHSPNTPSQGGDDQMPPTDIRDENDGHLWRAKYCVLENGFLYFYENKVIASSLEAEVERSKHSLLHGSSFSEKCNNEMSSTNILSMSPIPRPNMFDSEARFPSSLPQSCDDEEHVLWEKKVGLDYVGAVRSSEDEFGQYSFMLLTSPNESHEEQDCLVLRACSMRQMKEWLFQIHRSLALIIKEIVLCRDQNIFNKQRLDSKSFYPLSLDDSHMQLENSLSHGHGRNGLHRRRLRELNNKVTFGDVTVRVDAEDEQLIFQDESMLDSTEQNIQAETKHAARMLEEDNAITNPIRIEYTQKPVHLYQPPSLSFRPIAPPFNIPEPPKKYIPPHLRRPKDLVASTKYVPPHKRKNLTFENKVSSDQNDQTESSNKKDIVDLASESSLIDIQVSGGCADQELQPGSIMDPIFQKRSFKIGRGRTKTYGHESTTGKHIFDFGYNDDSVMTSLNVKWNVGAVSACGARESNEDAYLIVNDLIGLLYKLECEQQDMGKESGDNATVKPLPEKLRRAPKSLFAIFDGHCGFQAARFAAEKLPFFLWKAVKRKDTMLHRIDMDALFSNEKALENVLLSAIKDLDDVFCKIAVEDGREWGDCGTTAVITVLSNDTIFVANIGDCRGVLCTSTDLQGDKHEKSHVGLESDGWTSFDEQTFNDYEHRFCEKKRFYWKEVTGEPHNPSCVEEQERIKAANGWITTEQEICIGQIKRMDLEDKDVIDILKRWFSHRFEKGGKKWDQKGDDGFMDYDESSPNEERKRSNSYEAAPGRLIKISRICGELAVSRALGDRDFKASFNAPAEEDLKLKQSNEGNNQKMNNWWKGPNFLPYPQNHSCCFCGDLISPTPEFQRITLGKLGVCDEFLLLACDGLWDVMDPPDAVRIAYDLLFYKGWNSENVAARLATVALRLGSSDNITVIVIQFDRE